MSNKKEIQGIKNRVLTGSKEAKKQDNFSTFLGLYELFCSEFSYIPPEQFWETDAQVIVDLLESLHHRYNEQDKKMKENMPKGKGMKKPRKRGKR